MSAVEWLDYRRDPDSAGRRVTNLPHTAISAVLGRCGFQIPRIAVISSEFETQAAIRAWLILFTRPGAIGGSLRSPS